MKILTVGGGPGGLYASLLLKKANPTYDIQVIERNPAGATYGWGVVFSDRTLNTYREADSKTYQQITAEFVLWSDIDTYYRHQVIRCGGHSFAGMYRQRLLQILQERCRELGVRLQFETELDDLTCFSDYDLVIAADGVNSKIRNAYAADFAPSLRYGEAKYIWFGTDRVLDAFTFIFRENEHGLFQVHAYPFDGTRGTFIVECAEAVWRRAGLDKADETTSLAYCETLFADFLNGRRLLSNKSQWLNFVNIQCQKWRHSNIILLGDAAHTAHFSIGSGTKLAMDGAIALANAFNTYGDRDTALNMYELERRPRVESLQAVAGESQSYFENMKRYLSLEPLQFTSNLLTRSGRITYDSLRVRDAAYVETVDWHYSQASKLAVAVRVAPPPLFTPLTLRGLTLPNRVAVAPAAVSPATDGLISPATIGQLLAVAQGGAGLVVTDPTAVAAQGRITPEDPGLYNEAQQVAWSQAVAALHQQTAAKVCLQLNHAGRRGAVRPRRYGLDRPLHQENWPLLAPSPLPYMPTSQVPQAMDENEMAAVRDAFGQAARLADAAGFDMLYLNMAHGYLLGSFLSPLSNQRQDGYGGVPENRRRFPLAVLTAVRAAWPTTKPLCVGLNASDELAGGLTIAEAIFVICTFKEQGVDLFELFVGQSVPNSQPTYGAGFLVPYSEQARLEAGVYTLVRGQLTTSGEVNSILAAGRADVCLMTAVR